MNPLFSIIIPIYNPPYDNMQNCFDSIKKQSYTDYEVILVDDGSNNKCAEYLDDMVAHDERFRIIHKKNEGAAIARNVGIVKAEGNYIMFVDADDAITPFCLQQAAEVITKIDADLVIGLTKRCIADNKILDSMNLCSLEIDMFDYSDKLEILVNHMLGYTSPDLCFKKGYIGDGPCARVCRAELVKQAMFTEERIPNQDTIWNLVFLRKVKKAIIVNDLWYLYLYNSKSMTNKYRKNKVQEFKYRTNQELKLGAAYWPGCQQGIYVKIFRDTYSLCANYLFHERNRDSFYCRYKCYQDVIHTKAYRKMLKNINFASEDRIRYRLIKECIRFFSLHEPNIIAFWLWKIYCGKREWKLNT